MDPIVTAIGIILGKYAIDKGATLLKEGGEAVAKAAGNLFTKIITRLKSDPSEAKNAERFEQNPEAFKPAIEAAVADQMQADPNFAAELKALVASFDKAQKSAGVSIVNTGSGDVFTGDNAFKVGTNSGTINYGGTQTTTVNRSGGTDINGQGGSINITGDVTGRDKKGQ